MFDRHKVSGSIPNSQVESDEEKGLCPQIPESAANLSRQYLDGAMN